MKEQAVSSQVENHFLLVTTLLWKKKGPVFWGILWQRTTAL